MKHNKRMSKSILNGKINPDLNKNKTIEKCASRYNSKNIVIDTIILTILLILINLINLND